MRQIVLDTETTGLEIRDGNRIIEIGAIELVNRQRTGRQLHLYINPERDIEPGALEVHGITREFLADKPCFGEICEQFLRFIDQSELIIHNADFDVGFLDHELTLLDPTLPAIADRCQILDTLTMARQKHPGMRNSLDALCKRYDVDNTRRELHGALLDSELLAEVYLMMTGGQTALSLEAARGDSPEESQETLDEVPVRLMVLRASASEVQAHEQRLEDIDQQADGGCLWLTQRTDSGT